MSLVKVDRSLEIESASSRWRDREISRISHHGEDCCTNALSWLKAMDRAQRGADSRLSGPRWVLERFPWGPHNWPIYWCEAVKSENLDCGSLADLARTLYLARGVQCHSAQMVFQYSKDDMRHWTTTWLEADREADWIVGSHVYHETCAVMIDDDAIQIWDPTDNCWIMRPHAGGYSTPVAIRIIMDTSQAIRSVNWEGHQIECGVWQTFD